MRMANAKRRLRKTPTNLSVREVLVRPARGLGDAKRAEWESSNRDAIDAYNARAATHGVFSDAWRKF
jgi:hypothetical protein